MGRGAGSSLTSEQRVKRLVTLALPLYLTLLVASVHGFKALGLEIELKESVLKAQRLPWGLNSAELVTAKGVESAHSSATTAFSITAALTYQVWRWSHHPTKRSVALLVFAINFVAAINYGSKLLGLQPPLKAHGVFKSTTGVVVYGPLRYLEWVFTTSFLIRVVGCLTPDGPRAQRLIRSTIFYNVLVITLGAVEHWVCCAAAGAQAFELHRQVAVAIFVVACCLFWPVMNGQAALYKLAGETLSTPTDAEGLGALYRSTLVTWLLFPAFRAACLAGLVGPCTQETAYVLLDLGSKMGFSVFTLVGSFTLSGGA